MYAEDYRAMMVAKYGEDGYQLRELRERITERLPLDENFTPHDLAVLLDTLIDNIETVTGAALTLAKAVGNE